MNDIKFSKLPTGNEVYFGDLVALHQSTMETLLSELGRPFVEKYYLAAASNSLVIGSLALVDGNLAGWTVGSPDPSSLNKSMANNAIWFVYQLIGLIFTKPIVFFTLIRTLLQPGENVIPTDAIELTYIGVSNQYTRRGIGSRLLRDFCLKARSEGYKTVVLSVETENTPAVSLYKSFGFKQIAEYIEGDFHRFRMSLFLPEWSE